MPEGEEIEMKDLWYVFAGALLLVLAFGFGAVMTKVAPAVGEALAGFVSGLAGTCGR